MKKNMLFALGYVASFQVFMGLILCFEEFNVMFQLLFTNHPIAFTLTIEEYITRSLFIFIPMAIIIFYILEKERKVISNIHEEVVE